MYNGSALQYTDKDSNLLPFSDYQYSVTALNNVGKVSSLWEVVTTKEGPPDSVPAPAINVRFLYEKNGLNKMKSQDSDQPIHLDRLI